VTIKEAAAMLSVDEKTIRRMLPRLGASNMAEPTAKRRLIRIPVEGIEAFMEGRRIAPTMRVITKPFELKIERRRA
jgi:predicted DNA-binding transcriptional regulator YafY